MGELVHLRQRNFTNTSSTVDGTTPFHKIKKRHWLINDVPVLFCGPFGYGSKKNDVPVQLPIGCGPFGYGSKKNGG